MHELPSSHSNRSTILLMLLPILSLTTARAIISPLTPRTTFKRGIQTRRKPTSITTLLRIPRKLISRINGIAAASSRLFLAHFHPQSPHDPDPKPIPRTAPPGRRWRVAMPRRHSLARGRWCSSSRGPSGACRCAFGK